MKKLTFKNHWHNLYFTINALVWAGLIVFTALLFGWVFTFSAVLILMGICVSVSVISSAVMLKPGHRLGAAIVQIMAWISFLVVNLIFFPDVLIPTLFLFLPSAILSLGLLTLFATISYRQEKHLNQAMRRR